MKVYFVSWHGGTLAVVDLEEVIRNHLLHGSLGVLRRRMSHGAEKHDGTAGAALKIL